MKYIDAFSGIGGFSCAVHNLWPQSECVAAIENDADACKTFFANHKILPLGDIRVIDPNSLPDHDFLFGGFPCQPFSRNGKWYNKNNKTIHQDEKRGDLFHFLIQILKNKQPDYFIFENVKGLLSMKNPDGTLVIDEIEKCINETGYFFERKIISPTEINIPQQRNRVFLIGSKQPHNFKTFPTIELDRCVNDIKEMNVHERFFLEKQLKKRKNVKIPGNRWDALISAHSSGYWNVPQTKMSSIEPIAIIYGDTPSGLPRQQDKLYSKLGISPTIATFSTPAFDFDEGWRILTPRECMRLQGFSDDFQISSSDSVGYKQAGNAVCVKVVESILNTF